MLSTNIDLFIKILKVIIETKLEYLYRSCILAERLVKPTTCGFVSVQIRCKHTLPDLPYDYNALEPYISADIMKLHHQKHHATYINNFNIAEEKLANAVAKGKKMLVLCIFNILSRSYSEETIYLTC